ncbi:MAG: hypothetical protein HKP36_05810 [Myxococcales bacterium]|nr:VOC family protein [Deltaproteobacteria bacterium]NNL23950.1 hypothetical protein [Myxococcales bacterium]
MPPTPWLRFGSTSPASAPNTGGRFLEPPEAGKGALRSGFGVAHFGLQTTDLDGDLARLGEAGVYAHAEPRRTGSIRYAYVTAPDGVVIELVELHLPAHLARFVPLLNGVNRAIYLTRRTLQTSVLVPRRHYTHA